MMPPARRLRPETQLRNVHKLLRQADRLEGATILLTEVLPGRRQRKITTFVADEAGEHAVDLEEIAAEHGGKVVKFIIREQGQNAGTASWHVPEADRKAETIQGSGDGDEGAEPETPELGPTVEDAADPPIRTMFAELRSENRLLAETGRALRTQLAVLQQQLAGAKATATEAIRARERSEVALTALRAEQSQSEAALWILRDRVGEEQFAEIAEVVRGRS